MSALLAQIPNHLIRRAKPIVDAMLLSKSLLRWNRDLELVIKDDVVPDTNVLELITHALQPMNMKDRPPNGFSEFIACLRVLGLESQYVKNEYAKQVLDAGWTQYWMQGSDSSSGDSDSSSDSSDDESDAEMGEEEEEEDAGSSDAADSSDEERDAKRKEEKEEEEEEETGSASNEEQDAKREEETGSSSDDERDAKMEDEESGSDDNENLYINSSGFYMMKKEQEKARKKPKKKTKKSVNETPVNLPTRYTMVTTRTRRGFGGVSRK